MAGGALRIRAAHAAISEQRYACARPIACAARAFRIGIGPLRNRAANAVAATSFFRRRTRQTRAGTSIVATNAIYAIRRHAIGRLGTRHPIGSRLTCACAIARQTAFVIGIGIRSNRCADAIRAATFFRCGTGHARICADVSATGSIDAIVRQTLGRRRARNAIVVFARPRAGAGTIGAFVVGIDIVSDWSARAVGAIPLFRGGASFTKPRTRFVATHAIGAEAGSTLGGDGTRCAVGLG